MTKKVSILISFIILMASGLILADTPAAPPATPLPSHAVGIKKDWLMNMQTELPKLLCDKDHYFVQCYSTTEQECMEVMTLYVKACLNNVVLALPPELNKQQGEYWGQMVGRCSYDLFEKFMSGKKSDKTSCQAPAKAATDNDLPKPSQAIP